MQENTLGHPRKNRIKKILYRTWYRGCKETDKILGSFAKEYVHAMTDAELDLLEGILEEDDKDLYNWLTRTAPLPQEYAGNSVMQRLMGFKLVES